MQWGVLRNRKASREGTKGAKEACEAWGVFWTTDFAEGTDEGGKFFIAETRRRGSFETEDNEEVLVFLVGASVGAVLFLGGAGGGGAALAKCRSVVGGVPASAGGMG